MRTTEKTSKKRVTVKFDRPILTEEDVLEGKRRIDEAIEDLIKKNHKIDYSPSEELSVYNVYKGCEIHTGLREVVVSLNEMLNSLQDLPSHSQLLACKVVDREIHIVTKANRMFELFKLLRGRGVSEDRFEDMPTNEEELDEFIEVIIGTRSSHE